jgi:lysophospholipase L1-like esterase
MFRQFRIRMLLIGTCLSVVAFGSGAGSTKGIIDVSQQDCPPGATQLLGKNVNAFGPETDVECQWTFEDGVLTGSPGWDSVVSKDSYRNFRLHVEFNVPHIPDVKATDNGNSAIYIQQRYEIQILNSYGVSEADYKHTYGGSIYGIKKPDRLVNKPAGEWQTYDIAFRAARYEGDTKIENARVTVYQNQQLIHDDVEIPRKTGAGKKEGPEPRPIKLQGYRNPVQFRNIWVHALDLDEAFIATGSVSVRENFRVEGHDAFVIVPAQSSTDRPMPWVWYAPTLQGQPDVAMNWMFDRFGEAGIAVAGIDVGESYGSPTGRAIYQRFYEELVDTRKFSKKPVLVPRSRGGLMLYNWAAEHPESVAGIAGIYPVCNLASYPGLERAAGAYEMTAAQLETNLHDHNPIDRLAPLATAGIPIFHIHGDVDTVVPNADNSAILAQRYEKLGGTVQLEVAEGQGHNMWTGFFQHEPLIEFVVAHSGAQIADSEADRLPRVLLIGDSISQGYNKDVQELLKSKAEVFKHADNCGDTWRGLERLDTWLGIGDGQWDVIHFNWGLHDLCYRNPSSQSPGRKDKVNGTLSTTLEQYEDNLERLVVELKKTGATLIWANTTIVPDGESGRIAGDAIKYNEVAARVMSRHGIVTNDLHALTSGFDPDLFVGPGNVHFTADGSYKIAEQVATAIGEAVDASDQDDEQASRASSHPVPENPLWLTYDGTEGPGQGKHIVFIAADQEYRSEQSMPMLAKILSDRHGFDCTVLFGVNDNGEVDPTLEVGSREKKVVHNIPGLEHLAKADLLVLFSRMITLPDDQIAHIITYLDSGKPLIGIRTANHGFQGNFPYTVDGEKVNFGKDVLGGTFLNHHGNWHADSTRGILVDSMLDHPILTGVTDIWGPSDVYRTYPEGGQLPDDCQALVYGQPLVGREKNDAVNTKKEPLPVAWTKHWVGNAGKEARVFHVTMGSAKDYESPGLRRMTINAAYWCLEMEDAIEPASSADYVGTYAPLPSGFNYEKLNVVPQRPSAYR